MICLCHRPLITQNNNTKIYYKLYLLTKQFYRMVKNFPKEYKYELGRDIIWLSWRCLDLSLEANSVQNSAKAEKIKELSETFEKLKMRIRMSQEIRLITIGQFSHLEENFLFEIGRMIGGWKKWARNAGGRGT